VYLSRDEWVSRQWNARIRSGAGEAAD
jgi:hypothetical protein